MRLYPRIDLWRRFRRAADNWRADDGPTLAAAVAYYAALSLFPLLLLLISALGLCASVFRRAQNARGQLLELVARNASPILAEDLGAVLGQITAKAALGGPLALGALLLAAIGVFTQIEHAFDRIWKTPQPEWRGVLAAVLNALYFRLRAFLMLLGAGSLVLAAFAAAMAASAFHALTVKLPLGDWAWNAAEIAISVALFSVFFTLIYKALPKARVRWSEAARAACWPACSGRPLAFCCPIC